MTTCGITGGWLQWHVSWPMHYESIGCCCPSYNVHSHVYVAIQQVLQYSMYVGIYSILIILGPLTVGFFTLKVH